jgi:glutamate N-acetyltransferase / amino-acid N-acetyltransferase
LIELKGFRASGVVCGIKPSGRPDLALIVSDQSAAAAGVFTSSRFPGAPVVVSRKRMRRGVARAIVCNSGVSNVATGEQGLEDARSMTAEVAARLDLAPSEVQVASTGVIGRRLPMDRVREGIAAAVDSLSPTGWPRAARAIMTTDKRPKLVAVNGGGFGLCGIAKGAGMIMPNMATMLAFLASDAAIAAPLLDAMLREIVHDTFNCLTIDGEMSTSDMVLVLANGAAGGAPATTERTPRAKDFRKALADVCGELVERLATDGEGVTRLAEITVSGARSHAAADKVARKIANSALFKTALFGGDPNWGRIIQAAGAAGVPFAPGHVSVTIGGVELLRGGEPTGEADVRRRAAKAMKSKRVAIDVGIGTGPGTARVLTTDFSYDYVRINAEYTT